VTTVAVAPIRRWIRRTQAAHRERGETFGNFYFAVFTVLIVGGMVHRQLQETFWPVRPDASALAGAALVLILLALLHLLLRRLGPLALSRPAASWLLTAPIDRGRLLAPSLRLATVAAAAVGTLSGIAIVGHAAPRPVPESIAALLPLIGALVGVGALLVAFAAQRGRRWAAGLDNLAMVALATGLAGLVVDAARGAPQADFGWPTPVLLALVGALSLGVAAAFAVAVRALARTPNDRILEAATTAGTLADSVFGVEPSFVVDMVERRYWARRRLRSRPLWRRVPVLVAQDLRLARRRPRRLLALAGATTLPALFAHAPAWVLGAAVLAGGMVAAGTTTTTVRTDAANPVLLRLLGLSSRRAVTEHLVVPAVLAAVWSVGAFAVLQLLGALPAGPWWLLGLTLGPVGAVAAVRRARVGFVDNGLLPVDTPMGTVSTGPMLASVVGFDGLLFGLPALIAVAGGTPLTSTMIVVQAAVAAFGVRLYLSVSTAPDRVELTRTG
jgi:hypothetical protein